MTLGTVLRSSARFEIRALFAPSLVGLAIIASVPVHAATRDCAAHEPVNPLLVQRDYVVRYSTTLLVPLWSAEKLTWSKIGKVSGRVECFRADPRVPPLASLPSDYKEPIYDQGHSVPDADQDRTLRSVVSTYVVSNMSPQTCQLTPASQHHEPSTLAETEPPT